MSGKTADQGKEPMQIQVKSQEGTVIEFKIKKHTKLKKLMDAFCSRIGFRMDTVRFHFDGKRIQETDTPELLEMQDGDSIDAHLQMTGGMEKEEKVGDGKLITDTPAVLELNDGFCIYAYQPMTRGEEKKEEGDDGKLITETGAEGDEEQGDSIDACQQLEGGQAKEEEDDSGKLISEKKEEEEVKDEGDIVDAHQPMTGELMQ